MPKYTRKNIISDKTKDDAVKVARATQRPGQTKEQTKLIAQGIQKGIDLYKKQQKGKSRELDKKLRKVSSKTQQVESSSEVNSNYKRVKTNWLPWVLLLISWAIFTTYIFMSQGLLN